MPFKHKILARNLILAIRTHGIWIKTHRPIPI